MSHDTIEESVDSVMSPIHDEEGVLCVWSGAAMECTACSHFVSFDFQPIRAMRPLFLLDAADEMVAASDDRLWLEGCSLPPQVDGACCGQLSLEVTRVLESTAAVRSALPRSCLVRVRWWGERDAGSLFRPATGDGHDHNSAANCGVRFPICVDPVRLAAYFNDMVSL